MKDQQNRHDSDASIHLNHINLRLYLGILGILLPLILFIGNGLRLESSISHFYYTRMSVVFTGILCSFGFLLISYMGYEKKSSEFISDDFITNLAGLAALLVAIIPTACSTCPSGVPNGHSDPLLNKIHLISAGVFIVAMGYMSFVQFTKSDKSDELTKKRNTIYRACGLLIWITVLYLMCSFLFNFSLTAYDVFIGETIALVCFGIAWLIKSKSLSALGL